MMTCAPLAKSPNWASHITSERGSSSEYPNSKPMTAASDSELSNTSNGACFGSRFESG